MQNKSLRKVLGAYNAVSGPVLEKEANIPPISATLSKQIAKRGQKKTHRDWAPADYEDLREDTTRKHPTERSDDYPGN